MINKILLKSLIILTLFIFTSTCLAANDPLPSWNNNQTKTTIVQFVNDVTNSKSPNYVIPENRIATIDNDGTLWLEKPLYTQAIFAFDRIKALAKQHPEWQTEEPFKTILNGNPKAIAQLNQQDLAKIIATTHSGMTVNDFHNIVIQWITKAKNPRFNKPYTELVYQPMLELINYLKNNHFKVYIVTGGGQEFVRSFAKQTYNIESENIIGSAGKTQYAYNNGQPELIKLPAVLFIDDKQGKPEAIHLFIGKKPLIAIGNSDGDRQMLEWATEQPGKHLGILIHHDDAKREYAYDSESKIGTFSDSLMQEAKKQHWLVVSMKQDWKVIFPSND